MHPLVSEADFAKTRAAIADFAAKQGPQLQTKLVANDAANKHTSYISGTPASASARFLIPTLLGFAVQP